MMEVPEQSELPDQPDQPCGMLVCPETHQALRSASPEMLEKLNERIRDGKLQNRSGKLVGEPIAAGWVRDDGAVLYPIRGGIPLLLIEESIAVMGS